MTDETASKAVPEHASGQATPPPAATADPRDPKDPPRAAALLGYLGAIPFITAAVIVFFLYPREEAHMVLAIQLGYGAVILSFLGGIRWALAMLFPEDDALLKKLALSTVPALTGWIALVLPPVWGLVLLIAAFWAQASSDVKATKASQAPRWYGGYRVRITILVVGALLLSAAGIVLRS